MDAAGPPLRWLAQGEEHVPADRSWLSTAEAERCAALRFAKRRNDFLVSRWTAKQALARALGADAEDPARVEIRPRPTGAPRAFVDGVVAPCSVSLTDRGGWAVCLVGPPDRQVGCDLELVEERSAAFVSDWFTAAEQDLVSGAGASRHEVANLVWSAKESALKVLQTGLRRATRSVEVELHDERVGDWRALSVRAVEGQVFPGWWCRHGQFLLTVTADAPLPPPESLTMPTPLSEAVPTDSWLDELA